MNPSSEKFPWGKRARPDPDHHHAAGPYQIKKVSIFQLIKSKKGKGVDTHLRHHTIVA